MATTLPPARAYLAGDDAAHKLVVLRLVLEALADNLEEADLLARRDDVDLPELRTKLDDALTFAFVALEEAAPIESRP